MRKGVERSSHLELAHLLCIGMKRLAEKCPLRNEVVIPQVIEFLDLSKTLGSCRTRPWYQGTGLGTVGPVSGLHKFLRTYLLNVLSQLAFPEAFQMPTKQVLLFFSTAVRRQLFTLGHVPGGEGFRPSLWVPARHPNNRCRKS